MADVLPEVRIIAGPNGSGKTTFVFEFLPRFAQVRNFVNADLIASGLAPFAPESAALAAGRLMLKELRRLADLREDFAFETTMAGRAYESFLQRLKDQNYRIYLYFLWLPEVDMNVARVAQRVREGGHNVPEEDVRRRYRRGIGNFLNIYRAFADSWTVYDTSGAWPREIATALGTQLTIMDANAFQAFINQGSEA